MAQALADLLTPERLQALHELADRYGVHDVRVFGSYARGEARSDSDLDLLIDIDYGPGVSDRLVDFYLSMQDLFGMSVDVVTQGGLDPSLHARIFSEARAL